MKFFYYLGILLCVYIPLIAYFKYIPFRRGGMQKTGNDRICIFCPVYIIIIIYLSVKNMGYNEFFLCVFLVLITLFIFITSFITRTKMLNYIYLILCLFEFIYVLFREYSLNNYIYYYFGTSFETHTLLRFLDIFLACLSLSLSFFITSYLRKRKKEISFWALVFHFELLFLLFIHSIFLR
jgi:hypothetical protein